MAKKAFKKNKVTVDKDVPYLSDPDTSDVVFYSSSDDEKHLAKIERDFDKPIQNREMSTITQKLLKGAIF